MLMAAILKKAKLCLSGNFSLLIAELSKYIYSLVYLVLAKVYGDLFYQQDENVKLSQLVYVARSPIQYQPFKMV